MHKILIADDNPEIINQITDILDRFDYELYAAVNGNSAYMVAQKSLPDLIIMDWDMPELNGIDTLKLLKSNKNTKDILVIMITGVMNSIQNLKIAFIIRSSLFFIPLYPSANNRFKYWFLVSREMIPRD